jgi:hypothetical protein
VEDDHRTRGRIRLGTDTNVEKLDVETAARYLAAKSSLGRNGTGTTDNPSPSTVFSSRGGYPLRLARKLLGFDLLKQLARLLEQRVQLPAFLKSFARVVPMFQRVFIAAWSARSRCTAMHPTPPLAGDRWGPTGFTRASFGTAAWLESIGPVLRG